MCVAQYKEPFDFDHKILAQSFDKDHYWDFLGVTCQTVENLFLAA